MIFEKRIAKIGKSTNINLYLCGNQPTLFNVYISGKGVEQKNLTVNGSDYILSKQIQKYMYGELRQVSNNLAVARVDNSFSIIKVDSYGT